MRSIAKRSEPPIVRQHREAWQRECAAGIPGTTVARTRFNDLEKTVPRNQLVAEQAGLCAFCLGLIRGEAPLPTGAGTNIAHVTPLSVDPTRIFAWDNLVGSCIGGTNTAPHCDRAQGEQILHINPAAAVLVLEEHIDYSSKGVLRYRGPATCGRNPDEIQDEFDRVLKLNSTRLKENRAIVLEEVHARLPRASGPWRAADLDRAIKHWSTVGPEGYVPYFCVAIAYLTKKRRAAT